MIRRIEQFIAVLACFLFLGIQAGFAQARDDGDAMIIIIDTRELRIVAQPIRDENGSIVGNLDAEGIIVIGGRPIGRLTERGVILASDRRDPVGSLSEAGIIIIDSRPVGRIVFDQRR